MRVLLLAQWYHPVIGGEETHVRTLAHEVARRGHEVTVATLHQPGQPDAELDGAVRIRRIRAAVQRTARPLVASRMGALPEIINDSEPGLLVPPGDVPQLAHAGQRLAEDPALRNRMWAAAALRVRRCQASTVVPRIEDLYDQVIRDIGAR
jgi:hypothetical protein